MQHILINPFVIALLIIPVLALGWRSLTVIFLCIGCPLLVLWIKIWWDFQNPGYDPGLFGMMGLASFGISTCGFFMMLAGRALGLFLQSKGASRAKVFWIDILSFSIFVFAPMGLIAYDEFSRRVPKNSCIENGIPVEIGSTGYTLPHASVITVYETDINSAFYFFSNKSKRAICRKTKNGTRTLRIAELWVKPKKIVSGSRDTEFCKNAEKAWERAACSHMFCQYDHQKFETDWEPYACSSEELKLPDKLWIGRKGNWEYGDLSTEERALKTKQGIKSSGYINENDRFIKFDSILLPNSKPLFMRCRSSHGGRLWCKTDMHNDEGIRMSWELVSSEQNLQDDVKHTYNSVKTIVQNLESE